VKTGSLQAAQFGSENYFDVGTTIPAANATPLQPTQFQQRVTNLLQTIQLRQQITILL
jgi:hypothetical protein